MGIPRRYYPRRGSTEDDETKKKILEEEEEEGDTWRAEMERLGGETDGERWNRRRWKMGPVGEDN